MSKRFETGSEESINLIMESLKMVGIDCMAYDPLLLKGENNS